MAAKPRPREDELKELRVRIGRSRLRLDRHLRAAAGETQRLTSWKTYVRSFPGSAVTAALGLGLALSGGMKAKSIARWLGGRLMRQAWGSMRSGILAELHAIWVESGSNFKNAQGGGAKDE